MRWDLERAHWRCDLQTRKGVGRRFGTAKAKLDAGALGLLSAANISVTLGAVLRKRCERKHHGQVRMNAPHEYHFQDDGPDLIEMFSIVWRGKIVVILAALIFLGLSVVYLVATPGKYVGEFVLRGPTGARLAAYAPLNDVILEHYALPVEMSDQAAPGFQISSASLELDMVRELQDYDEFERALRENNASVREMSEDSFENARTRLFSKLKITPATERVPESKVELEWPDEGELLRILGATLTMAEQSLNAGKLESLAGLADNIERRSQTELRKLERDLVSTREAIDLEKESRLLFLKEQAEIARTLDLEGNNLAMSGQENQVNLRVSSGPQTDQEASLQNYTPKAIYLRGYKSLEKEHALLTARTDEQNYILNLDFLELKRKAIQFRNDEGAVRFREAINESPFAQGAEMFYANQDTIWIKNTRNSAMILIVGLLFGAILGSVIVLLRSRLARQKQSVSAG